MAKSRHKRSRSRLKRSRTKKNGGGILQNLKKNFNIIKKDPIRIKQIGRETDLRLILSLFTPEEWRMVKLNLLTMSKKSIIPINASDNILKRATEANINFASPE